MAKDSHVARKDEVLRRVEDGGQARGNPTLETLRLCAVSFGNILILVECVP